MCFDASGLSGNLQANKVIFPMKAAGSALLQGSIEFIAVPNMLIGHRYIMGGDENALLPGERAASATSVVKVRRASGAARIVARELLHRLDRMEVAIPKAESGMPIWPDGIVGSLAHDSTIAVAAVARRCYFLSVGIDIEPEGDLDPSTLDLVFTAKERRQCPAGTNGRLLFCIKEAVYKAVFPLDGVFLDHQDIEVCLVTRTAVICNGRIVSFRYCAASHIVVAAFVPTIPIMA
jgi:4'-phosphopantetheinyl transferase EntD